MRKLELCKADFSAFYSMRLVPALNNHTDQEIKNF